MQDTFKLHVFYAWKDDNYAKRIVQ